MKPPLHMALEDCTLCRGTGWKLVPRTDGAAGSVAVACDCGMQDRAARVMERARIPKRYEHCDFESYVTDLADGKTWTAQHAQSLKQAKLLTQGFVRDYPGSAEKGLLLMGPSGIGKTHLGVAALKELIRRGHAGLFCDYRELLKEIQASYNPASESTEMGILEPIRTVEILVLDDLGASKPSAWVLDIIGLVLNARYNEKRVTILTTNFLDEPAPDVPADAISETGPRGKIQYPGTSQAARMPSGQRVTVREDALADRIGARMRSRLFEMCRTVEVFAPDFRREVRQVGRAQ
ncbi:MAG TPA: ATP-binding protein [Candidatus Acidoferrum sp.]|nr:ATP-binding protein [Candidatus Acidoferrum sp.]